MTNVLLFWKNYARDFKRHGIESLSIWYSNASLIGKLQENDRIWWVSSGKILKIHPEPDGFLIAVGQVAHVEENLLDTGDYPSGDYKYRIIFNREKIRFFDPPVNIDTAIRPPDRNKSIPIGQFLQGPRQLKDERFMTIQKQIEEQAK